VVWIQVQIHKMDAVVEILSGITENACNDIEKIEMEKKSNYCWHLFYEVPACGNIGLLGKTTLYGCVVFYSYKTESMKACPFLEREKNFT